MKREIKYETIERISLLKEPTSWKRLKIDCPQAAESIARQFFNSDIEIYESMFIMLLNRAGMVTGYAKISQGGTAGTVLDVKIVAKYALESLSEAVILVHNHPSGNLRPSEADKRITIKTKDALQLFDIQLQDHLIITKDGYYSMADNGDF